MIIIFKHSLGLKDTCHPASKSAIKAYQRNKYKNKNISARSLTYQ